MEASVDAAVVAARTQLGRWFGAGVGDWRFLRAYEIRDALPERLNETAYALACDVVAADGKLPDMELRMLEEVREELAVDRLHAAAIEWGARVRHLRA